MRMAYLCRCDSLKRVAVATHAQQSKGRIWSQVRWNVTFVRRKGEGGGTHTQKGGIFPPKTRAWKSTSEVKTGEGMFGICLFVFFAQGQVKKHLKIHHHTPGGFTGTQKTQNHTLAREISPTMGKNSKNITEFHAPPLHCACEVNPVLQTITLPAHKSS